MVNQVRNKNITKNGFLKSYKHRVWDLLESFNAFNIQSIPRKENKHVDRHEIVDASYDVPRSLEMRRSSILEWWLGLLSLITMSIGKCLSLMKNCKFLAE